MRLSVYPAKRFWPSADQANEVQFGSVFDFMLGSILSTLSSSTTDLSSRSQILITGPIAEHSH